MTELKAKLLVVFTIGIWINTALGLFVTLTN